MAAGLRRHLARSTANVKVICSSVRPTGCFLRRRISRSIARSGSPIATAAALPPADGRSARHRRRCRAGALAGALAASPAQIISAASDGPMSRVSRCVPPQPGIRPIFVSGRPISVFGMRAGEAIVEAERQFRAAAHAGAVDGRDGRKRQRFNSGDEVETAHGPWRGPSRRRVGRRPVP